MANIENLKKFIWIDKQIKELEFQKKVLQSVIMEDDSFEKESVDWVNVSRVKQQRVGVKKGMESEVIEKFPDAVKTSFDTAKLKKIPEANEYLEINIVEFLQCKTPKNGEPDEDDF